MTFEYLTQGLFKGEMIYIYLHSVLSEAYECGEKEYEGGNMLENDFRHLRQKLSTVSVIV